MKWHLTLGERIFNEWRKRRPIWISQADLQQLAHASAHMAIKLTPKDEKAAEAYARLRLVEEIERRIAKNKQSNANRVRQRLNSKYQTKKLWITSYLLNKYKDRLSSSEYAFLDLYYAQDVSASRVKNMLNLTHDQLVHLWRTGINKLKVFLAMEGIDVP